MSMTEQQKTQQAQKAEAAVGLHEGLIYAMVTMSAVDRKMTDEELSRIGDIVSHLPVFEDYDGEQLVGAAEACGELLGHDGGLDRVLKTIARAVPKKLHETAYALALEVAAADQNVRVEEMRLLELLAEELGLDQLTTAAIRRGVRARLVRA